MPYPKAMAYINYNDDQVLFIDALYLVTLLDCAGHYDHVDNQLTCVKIAKAFAYVRYIFEHSDPGDFDNASSVSFIRQCRLDTPQGMMDYIANLSPPTSTKLPTSTLTGRTTFRTALTSTRPMTRTAVEWGTLGAWKSAISMFDGLQGLR
ncbi:hypothetical protein BGZ90_005129 [Linnemannia elongata]|nr:hypothetical protein BGZ90_005129 [Linnemannia elongata]